jgi:hypothetical protein
MNSEKWKFIKYPQTDKKIYIKDNYIYINCYYYGFWIHKDELDKYYINNVSIKDYYKLK